MTMLKIAYELGLLAAMQEEFGKEAGWGTLGKYIAAPAVGGGLGYALGGKSGIAPGMGLGLGGALGSSLVKGMGTRAAAQSMQKLKHVQQVAGGTPVWNAVSGKASYRLP